MARGPRGHLIAAVERVGLYPWQRASGRRRKCRRGEWSQVEVLYDRVAGLDIGKATLTACVRTPGPRGRRGETRTFSTMTRSLEALRDWLLANGVTIAAMESISNPHRPHRHRHRDHRAHHRPAGGILRACGLTPPPGSLRYTQPDLRKR